MYEVNYEAGYKEELYYNEINDHCDRVKLLKTKTKQKSSNTNYNFHQVNKKKDIRNNHYMIF